jgi:hypothetical protein
LAVLLEVCAVGAEVAVVIVAVPVVVAVAL